MPDPDDTKDTPRKDSSGTQALKAIEQEQQARATADKKLSRKLRIDSTIKWAVGVAVTSLGIYVAWKTATFEDRITNAVAHRIEGMVDAKLTSHLQSTRQSNLDTAREALRLQREEELARLNPAPINRSPEVVASRTKQR